MTFFSLKIIASDRVFFDGKCSLLVVPGIDGELGVMAHRQNMMTAVDVGEMRYTTPDGVVHHVIVGKGMVQMMNNRVVAFVETAESPQEVDVKRAEEAKERALEQMRQKQSTQQHYHTKASLARAMSRLKITGKYNI